MKTFLNLTISCILIILSIGLCVSSFKNTKLQQVADDYEQFKTIDITSQIDSLIIWKYDEVYLLDVMRETESYWKFLMDGANIQSLINLDKTYAEEGWDDDDFTDSGVLYHSYRQFLMEN